MGKRFYRKQEVLQRTGLAPSTVYALIARKEFPRSIPLTNTTRNGRAAAVAWDADEVDAWVEARIAAARGEAA